MQAKLATAVLAGLLLLGCGGDTKQKAPPPNGDEQSVPGPISPGKALGPGISVEQALAANLDGPLLVNGWLWRSDAEPRMCSSLSGSVPPKCGEPSLLLKGVDLSRYTLEQEKGAAWSAQPVQLLGTLRGKVFTVAARSLG